MPTPSGHTSAIRAKKVIGSGVKDNSGSQIGKIEDIVLDKMSDNVMFAVVGFGGVLGMGEKYHPIPWSTLSYDPSQDCYVLNVTKEALEQAPADKIDELTRADGTAFRDRSYQHYGAQPYWRQ
jgi:sporulation protein YlmC with PRC-barrel domain